jgi:hypothetical protein
MLDLYNYSLPTVIVVALALIFGASEVGRRLGMRLGSGYAADDLSTLEGAMLGLVALIIGFSFAMALSRFEARRDAILAEANAIGTTALRARLLPEPHRKEVLGLLRDYVGVRLDVTRSAFSQEEITKVVRRSNAIQEALWQKAMAVAATDNQMVPTGLFIQTLNETIDDQEKRLAALWNRVPNVVPIVLIAAAALACGFAGFVRGMDAKPNAIPVYVMALLMTVVIWLILDLDRPGAGFIEISQQPMLDAAAALAAFPD